MKERKIRLCPKDVREFVDQASRCDFDVDIFYNHFIIDAKSILGVMGLDLSSVLTVKYAGENSEFENYLSNLVAC